MSRLKNWDVLKDALEEITYVHLCNYTQTWPAQTMSKETSPTYFCLSHENIILALKYIKEGTDDQLKADCEDVIRKLSEGSTHLKDMLRKAHKALKG